MRQAKEARVKRIQTEIDHLLSQDPSKFAFYSMLHRRVGRSVLSSTGLQEKRAVDDSILRNVLEAQRDQLSEHANVLVKEYWIAFCNAQNTRLQTSLRRLVSLAAIYGPAAIIFANVEVALALLATPKILSISALLSPTILVSPTLAFPMAGGALFLMLTTGICAAGSLVFVKRFNLDRDKQIRLQLQNRLIEGLFDKLDPETDHSLNIEQEEKGIERKSFIALTAIVGAVIGMSFCFEAAILPACFFLFAASSVLFAPFPPAFAVYLFLAAAVTTLIATVTVAAAVSAIAAARTYYDKNTIVSAQIRSRPNQNSALFCSSDEATSESANESSGEGEDNSYSLLQ